MCLDSVIIKSYLTALSLLVYSPISIYGPIYFEIC